MKRLALLITCFLILTVSFGVISTACNCGGDESDTRPFSDGDSDVGPGDDDAVDDDSADDDVTDDDDDDVTDDDVTDDDVTDDDTTDDDATDDDATDDDTTDDDDDFADCPEGFPYEPANCYDTAVRGSLEWTQCDTGEDISFYCAVHYAAELDLDGKQDWRLPTRTELADLWDINNEYWVDCGSYWVDIVSPLFLTCYQVWTGESYTSSSAFLYNFMNGEEASNFKGESNDIRALAVRDVVK